MADDGAGPRDDDIWADTRPDSTSGSEPPPGPGEADPANLPPPDPDQTTAMPPTDGGGDDATTVQPPVGPAAGMGAAAGAAAAGGAAGAGGGGAPPPVPPGEEYPPGDEPVERPPWLLPAAIGLLAVLIIGLIAILASGDDDDDAGTSTTSAADTSTSSEPLFVPIGTDETGGSTSTSAQTSTTATPTTVPGTTPVTQPPTTAAPTQPPTTAAPTQPPTTAPPDTEPPDQLPDPGFASVDGQVLQISAACLTRPTADSDLEVASYLVSGSQGRIVIERWFEASADGVDVELFDTDQRASTDTATGDGVDQAFTATAQGDVTVEVAVNPPSNGVPSCPDFIETKAEDGSDTHVYSLLDVCVSGGGLDVAGIGSEGAWFVALDDDGDTAELRFSDRSLPVLTDPAATRVQDDTIVTYTATASGDGQTRDVSIDIELTGPRQCSADELNR
jgi:hypothetical protein